MWACWASRVSKRFVPALAALVLLSSLAQARTAASPGDDSGRAVSRVRISSSGTAVDADAGDGLAEEDSLGAGEYGDSGSGMVRLFSDARVGPDEHLDGDVVAVFGSAHIAGHVTGTVVAVFGSVDFEPGASIGGDAVAVGGSVEDEEGVRVNGQTVSVGLAPLTFGLPGLPVMLGLLALGWLVTLFFAWIFAMLFPERLARVAVTSSRRTLLSLLLGLLAFLCMPVISILLIVTVIGLPIGIMLPFAYVALTYAGQIAGSYVLGSKLIRRPLGAPGPMPAIVAGNLLVGGFFVIGVVLWGSPGVMRTIAVFFHLVGLLVITGLSFIGSGAFLLSRLGTRPVSIDEGEPSMSGGAPAGAGAPQAAGS